jgi:hypothetical protein
MLTTVPLADDFRATLRTLPDGWSEVLLELTFDDEERAGRAAALLGSIGGMRRGSKLRFLMSRDDPTRLAGTVLRGLQRIERERLGGEARLVEVREASERPAAPPTRASLGAAWDREEEKLPPDWTDVYAELQVSSTDYLDPAALLVAPLNPSRVRDRAAFRFRVARTFGYGASTQMVRRCLERLDEAGITGELRIVHALSDTKPVATQGPVLYREGQVL